MKVNFFKQSSTNSIVTSDLMSRRNNQNISTIPKYGCITENNVGENNTNYNTLIQFCFFLKEFREFLINSNELFIKSREASFISELGLLISSYNDYMNQGATMTSDRLFEINILELKKEMEKLFKAEKRFIINGKVESPVDIIELILQGIHCLYLNSKSIKLPKEELCMKAKQSIEDLKKNIKDNNQNNKDINNNNKSNSKDNSDLACISHLLFGLEIGEEYVCECSKRTELVLNSINNYFININVNELLNLMKNDKEFNDIIDSIVGLSSSDIENINKTSNSGFIRKNSFNNNINNPLFPLSATSNTQDTHVSFNNFFSKYFVFMKFNLKNITEDISNFKTPNNISNCNFRDLIEDQVNLHKELEVNSLNNINNIPNSNSTNKYSNLNNSITNSNNSLALNTNYINCLDSNCTKNILIKENYMFNSSDYLLFKYNWNNTAPKPKDMLKIFLIQPTRIKNTSLYKIISSKDEKNYNLNGFICSNTSNNYIYIQKTKLENTPFIIFDDKLIVTMKNLTQVYYYCLKSNFHVNMSIYVSSDKDNYGNKIDEFFSRSDIWGLFNFTVICDSSSRKFGNVYSSFSDGSVFGSLNESVGYKDVINNSDIKFNSRSSPNNNNENRNTSSALSSNVYYDMHLVKRPLSDIQQEEFKRFNLRQLDEKKRKRRNYSSENSNNSNNDSKASIDENDDEIENYKNDQNEKNTSYKTNSNKALSKNLSNNSIKKVKTKDTNMRLSKNEWICKEDDCYNVNPITTYTCLRCKQINLTIYEKHYQSNSNSRLNNNSFMKKQKDNNESLLNDLSSNIKSVKMFNRGSTGSHESENKQTKTKMSYMKNSVNFNNNDIKSNQNLSQNNLKSLRNSSSINQKPYIVCGECNNNNFIGNSNCEFCGNYLNQRSNDNVNLNNATFSKSKTNNKNTSIKEDALLIKSNNRIDTNASEAKRKGKFIIIK